ncbi:TIM-barrel domain-containing protein [Actinokineospora xionganensis]|uniref:Carbohydrate-binding protein n=1 Tax=Actinokineospora xionganensis TaxID=2684470 RepID=A0ABR7L7I7_9PSEU|nr:TIM-barrel domain-containing protein [Actinokineospora xionganensis]MBC6448663.1 carbohydrate-binding protein [Actinokineospora xionganensis]
MRRAALLATAIALATTAIATVPAHAAGLGAVTGVAVTGDTLDISVGADKLVVQVLRPDVVKVDYRPGGDFEAPTQVIDPAKTWGSGNTASIDTASDPMVVTTSRLTVKIDKNPARLSIYDSVGALVLREQAAEGVHPDGVKFTHAAGDRFYGITSSPVPWAENDPKQNLAEGMQRNDGGRVSANQQGDAGAPLAYTSRYGLLVDSVDGDFAITDTALEYSGVSTVNVSYYVTVGAPKNTMGAVAEISGKPAMSPKWAFGFNNSEWGTDQAEVEAIVQGYRSRGIPLDAFTLDFDFKAWGEDDHGEFRWNSTSGAGNVHPNKFPDGASGAFAATMAAAGVKLMGIMKPRVIVEKAGGGNTVQGQWGKDNHCFYPGRADYPEYFSQRLANDVDFAKQHCREWFWQHSKPLADTGIAGWWNDEADEAGGYVFNSLQHVNMQRSLYEGQRLQTDKRVMSLNRNFYLGGQRYGYGMWSGDIDSDATTMANQRTRMLTAVNLGETKWGMDIGGFSGDPTAQTYARWMQFGAFVPLYRVHGTHNKQRQPWMFGPTAELAAKEAIELRGKLMPYIYAHDRENHETGIGLVRPLFAEFPDDPTAANLTSEWMFGDSLLVAPVVEQDVASKRVYLPEGTWTDWFRGTSYTGPVTIDYPVNASTWRDIPLFVREGGIVATQDVQQHVGESVVRQQELNVFPGSATSESTVYDDDGVSNGYESGSYFKQRVTARRSADSVTVTTDPKTGTYATPLTHHIVKVNKWSGAGATIDGAGAQRYDSLAALKAAPGEGWATGADQYGGYTAVRVAVGTAKQVVIDGSAPGTATTSTVEAENAALSGGAGRATNHAGHSGSGFVDGYWNVGASTAFTVTAANAGRHAAILRYANATGAPRTLSITVNGVRDQLTLPPLANWDTWGTQTTQVSLQPGANTITYARGPADSGDVNLDSLTLSAGPPRCGTRHQAEAAAHSGGARSASNHVGYSGGGFVDGYWNTGATTTFTVDAATAGPHAATLRYANATGSAKRLTLAVNGAHSEITLPALPNWDTWGDHRVELPLAAGANTVSYKHGPDGDVNLDHLDVLPGAAPCRQVVEAETGVLTGGAQRVADHVGYSGTGFVDRFTAVGATVTFTVHAPAAGTYPLTARFANATGGARTLSRTVNGESVHLTVPAMADWDTWTSQTSQVALTAGANTISFSYGPTDSGNVNLDHLVVDF